MKFVLKETSSGDWLEVQVMWSHWDSESPCLFQISYEVQLLGMGNSCLKKPCLVVSRDWFWKIWLSKISVAELISTQIIVGQLLCGQCANLVTPSATRCHTTKVESVIGTRSFKVYPTHWNPTVSYQLSWIFYSSILYSVFRIRSLLRMAQPPRTPLLPPPPLLVIPERPSLLQNSFIPLSCMPLALCSSFYASLP